MEAALRLHSAPHQGYSVELKELVLFANTLLRGAKVLLAPFCRKNRASEKHHQVILAFKPPTIQALWAKKREFGAISY